MNGAAESSDYKVIEDDVVDVAHPHFHDPKKLATSLMRLYFDRATVRTEVSVGEAGLAASR